MVTCTILICIGVVIGIFALIALGLMGGALVMAILDLIIFGFAVYGFVNFIKWYRNR